MSGSTVSADGDDVAFHGQVRDLAGGAEVELVWRNELGGLTFRTLGEARGRYIKWQPTAGLTAAQCGDVDLVREAEKLRWAGCYVPVPRVIDCGATVDGLWLVTAAIDATSAVDPRWRDRPETAVRAIATGLRRLHDTLPVDECRYRDTWIPPGTRTPEPDRLVVCHGDPCVPNTLLDNEGQFTAHVDFSRLGVADRWADLAIATASISWDFNFGGNYDELFFEAYGVAPDAERIRFYRELWDAP
ncbi:aminoglycoside 3'-phosphotransferase [Mycolicibacterium brumae]|uniref:Aminoglycoside 3'-phosphotransferase n=1 Tax=Mycolicibacterium brumae TaxID=85968 RepID=A0A2G5PEN7_9MYCO|nr:aminoglycoside 3'-phosphotransferase [Mycolicibacterium brumae]MCV7192031.1 aminoglycoside 3'-phosphotransferase [Mycolicibacterium brumae]PIB76766.1 aminoglycoside 3'-phosphotransferase [Mycolicibacterium brumae]RWA20698.1 hypothetical protein MBRU_03300 [Mycolicibacterium brumae DSM 44177]UWW07796.1 aminoglycoside 3'-phosphotransferase [Mycolicibacterium brumae]